MLIIVDTDMSSRAPQTLSERVEATLRSQDLEGFESGAKVRMEPIRVEAKCDEPCRNGKPLSDHDEPLVYRLSWPLHSRATPFKPVCA